MPLAWDGQTSGVGTCHLQLEEHIQWEAIVIIFYKDEVFMKIGQACEYGGYFDTELVEAMEADTNLNINSINHLQPTFLALLIL